MSEWKLVPVDPTPEMIEAGCNERRKRLLQAVNAMRNEEYVVRRTEESVVGDWKAVIAAAPQPEQKPVAWIEHHKSGDNLSWDEPGKNQTALYAAPRPDRDPQPLIDALRKIAFDKGIINETWIARDALAEWDRSNAG